MSSFRWAKLQWYMSWYIFFYVCPFFPLDQYLSVNAFWKFNLWDYRGWQGWSAWQFAVFVKSIFIIIHLTCNLRIVEFSFEFSDKKNFFQDVEYGKSDFVESQGFWIHICMDFSLKHPMKNPPIFMNPSKNKFTKCFRIMLWEQFWSIQKQKIL